MIKPYNDNILIEIKTDEYGFAGKDEQKGVENGILIAVPDEQPLYVGMHSFAFENSYNNDANGKFVNRLRKLIGKRLYWTQFQERGSILKQGSKTYAILKFTDIIAVDNKDAEQATSITTESGIGVGLN